MVKNKGVYCIYNTATNKLYVGSSIDLKSRWRRHKRSLKNNIHANDYLQNAWNRYGEYCFVFHVLEYVDPASDILGREQFYLDRLLTHKEYYGYNICREAGSTLGLRHSEETIKLLSKAKLEYYKNNPGAAKRASESVSLGLKKHHKENPDTRKRVSENMKEYCKENIELRRKISRGVVVNVKYLLTLGTLKQYQIAKKFGISTGTVSRIKRNKLLAYKSVVLAPDLTTKSA